MHFHFHIHKIHILKNELSEVYANLAIQSFAVSLVAVFIPIYLMSVGMAFGEMLMFFLVFYGILGIFSPFSALLANRFGFKHIILLRTPLLIAFLLGLYYIDSLPFPPMLLAAFGSVPSSLYWVSINSIFAEHSDKLHRGRQTGSYFSYPQIASLAGPTAGGVISMLYGFQMLFLITSVLILVSVVPLFMTGDTKPHIEFSLKKMLKLKDNIRFCLYFALDCPKFVAGAILWPIFVYWGLSGSTTGTGFSQTLAGAGILIFTYYIGRKADNENKTSLIKKGALLLGVLWFARIFARTPLEFFGYSLLGGFFTVLIDVPFTAASFDQANKENPDEFVVLRELAFSLGRVMFLSSIILIPDAMTGLLLGFGLAGITSLMFAFF